MTRTSDHAAEHRLAPPPLRLLRAWLRSLATNLIGQDDASTSTRLQYRRSRDPKVRMYAWSGARLTPAPYIK